MVSKIFLICCWLMFSVLDARYKKYHNPVWQGSAIPYYGTYEPIAVKPLYDEEHSRVEDNQHLFNMSIELMRDVNIKNRHSVRIQHSYKESKTYQLGLFAAGSIDKFAHMVKIFRYYTQPEIYEVASNETKLHPHVTNIMHQAYQIMQGDYNEMRIENEMFFELVGEYEKSVKEEKETITIVDIESAVNIEEFKGLQEHEQNQKIEELKAMFAGNRRNSRRMAGSLKRTNLNFTSDAAQEEFKKSLRYQKWAKKWDGFDPSLEGIEVSKPLAKMGQNISNFLGVNAF